MSTKIGDIKNNPRNYVDKEVTVSGEVTQTFSLLVIKYFTVRDDSGEITVVTEERPLPRQGQRLKIRGVVKEAFSIGAQSLLVIQEKPERDSQMALP
jgi:aspartyl/asparaginyl-tRNA synthetase